MQVDHDFLAELVRRRRESGLTQNDLAERMRYAQSSISQLENDLIDPRLSTVMRYASAVGATLEVEDPRMRARARQLANGLQLAHDTTPPRVAYAWVNPSGLLKAIAFLREVAGDVAGDHDHAARERKR